MVGNDTRFYLGLATPNLTRPRLARSHLTRSRLTSVSPDPPPHRLSRGSPLAPNSKLPSLFSSNVRLSARTQLSAAKTGLIKDDAPIRNVAGVAVPGPKRRSYASI
jgi:hypothetical protein